MRQAIQTKFFGLTNTRGARIKATAEAGSAWAYWDYAVGIEENHTAAARKLAEKFGWAGNWWGGGLPGRGYVFVISDTAKPDFIVEAVQ